MDAVNNLAACKEIESGEKSYQYGRTAAMYVVKTCLSKVMKVLLKIRSS